MEGYFARYGGRTILIGRFIGLVRALAPFIAGSSKMPYRNFAPFSILGTGLWSTGLILVGYFFAQSLDTVTKVVGKGLLVFAIVIGVGVGLFLAFRFLRDPENRGKLAAEMEKRRALRPAAGAGTAAAPAVRLPRPPPDAGRARPRADHPARRALGRALRADRLLVGGLGRSRARRPGTRPRCDVAHDLQAGWLTNAAKGFTDLGSGWVTWPLAALVAVALAAARRWMEFWVLVVGHGR